MPILFVSLLSFWIAKRLGVLFVVNPRETGAVEFTKLTLWGCYDPAGR